MLQVWKDRSHGAGMQGGRLSGSFFQSRVRGDRERRKKDDEMNFWRIKKTTQTNLSSRSGHTHFIHTVRIRAHGNSEFFDNPLRFNYSFFLFVSRFLLFVGIHFRDLVVVDVFFGHS